MKKFRLLILALSLAGGLSTFNAPVSVSACEDDEDEIAACPKYQPRPNGCKCCSDNHCTSGFCDGNNTCSNKPLHL